MRFIFAFVAFASLLLDQLTNAQDIPLQVYSVYDNITCGGNVVQNNYLVAPGGVCAENAKCSKLSYANNVGAVIGCCTTGTINAYSKKTFGNRTNSVTWMIYSDKACWNLMSAIDSEMTTSKDTARCNPIDEQTSKKFVYSASDKSVTEYKYTGDSCAGDATTSSIQQDLYGKCIPFGTGTGRLMAFATIDGVTYGINSGETIKLEALLVLFLVGFLSFV